VNRLATRHEVARGRLTRRSRQSNRDGRAIGVAEPSATHPVGPHRLTWEMFFDLMHGQQEAISQLAEEVDEPGLSE
jgi:hypothetical protein